MPDEALIMDLGLGARAYKDLDRYERFVFAERLLGYCIFPNDEVERSSYLVCKSAYRLQGFQAKGPHNAVPRELRRLRSANRSRYLREERQFYRANGADSAALWSYGLKLYKEYEIGFNMQAIQLAFMFYSLRMLEQTSDVRTPFSLAKVAHLYVSEGSSKIDVAEKVKPRFCPLGPPRIPAKSGSNERDLLDLWRHNATVLPYVITYGMYGLQSIANAEIRRRETGVEVEPDVDPKNIFYDYEEAAFAIALGVEQFLTTKCPHPGKVPFIRKDTLAKFKPRVLSDIAIHEIEDAPALTGALLKSAQEYKVVSEPKRKPKP